mgnify:CR=1 FL=1
MSVPDLSHLKGSETILVTMVCYGNICRSPMAAAVLSNKVALIPSPKIVVDSAGTANFHVGEGANPPSQRVWERAGYRYQHRASQFDYSRLVAADLVLVMDDFNHQEVSKLVTSDVEESKIYYLRQFDPSATDSWVVPDPYSLPDSAFEEVLELVERATDGLITELLR